MKFTVRQKELLETEAVAVASINEDGSPNVIAVGNAEYQTKGKWATYVKAMKENIGFPAKAAVVINVTAVYKLG